MNDYSLTQIRLADYAIRLHCGINLFEYLNENKDDCFRWLIDDLLFDIDDSMLLEYKCDDIPDINIEQKDVLGAIYSTYLDNKKDTGTYYTPDKVAQKLIDKALMNYRAGQSVYDPCCGTGSILLQLPDNIDANNIYGNDIDILSILITRINMFFKYPELDYETLRHHFTTTDYLRFKDKKYDYIIGNPPWGYKFDDIDLFNLKIKYRTAQDKGIDSYCLVIEKAIQDGNENIYFIVPESILTTINKRTIREVILANRRVHYINYLGDVFNNVQCPSIILGLGVKDKLIEIEKGDVSYKINHNRLNSNLFNCLCDDVAYRKIQHMENRDNIVRLKNNAVFALGIVTGNNKKHIKDKGSEVIIKGTDIEQYRIKDIHNYIDYNPKEYQQVAPDCYYRADEKLVYKFISKSFCFAYDNQQRLTLNSCNILIPKIEGLDIKYIMAVLNSRIVEWWYSNKYGCIKILRSHIEDVPIPYIDSEKQKEIIELVDKQINGQDVKEEIDRRIEDLYAETIR